MRGEGVKLSVLLDFAFEFQYNKLYFALWVKANKIFTLLPVFQNNSGRHKFKCTSVFFSFVCDKDTVSRFASFLATIDSIFAFKEYLQ